MVCGALVERQPYLQVLCLRFTLSEWVHFRSCPSAHNLVRDTESTMG